MKKLIATIITSIMLMPCGYSFQCPKVFKCDIFNSDIRGVKSTLNSQVRYANKTNFDKFISTYDESYLNSDGFDLNTYSLLVKDLWETYDKIKYGIKINDIKFENDKAIVSLVETSYADIPISKEMNGILKSTANSVYILKKINGKWKVVSDCINDETTSMLYGDAMNLDISLTAPNNIEQGVEYTASLEFVPPKDTFAIASIAKDIVEYPQKQAQEVFRRLPDDNILERLFVSNTKNANEYIIASIGLTKADVKDLSIKLSLSGFGYKIIRVNVKQNKTEEGNNVKE